LEEPPGPPKGVQAVPRKASPGRKIRLWGSNKKIREEEFVIVGKSNRQRTNGKRGKKRAQILGG